MLRCKINIRQIYGGKKSLTNQIFTNLSVNFHNDVVYICNYTLDKILTDHLMKRFIGLEIYNSSLYQRIYRNKDLYALSMLIILISHEICKQHLTKNIVNYIYIYITKSFSYQSKVISI